MKTMTDGVKKHDRQKLPEALHAKVAFFCVRLAAAIIIFSSIFILTQDVQIFPGATFTRRGKGERASADTPSGIVSSFIKTPDNRTLEVWSNKEALPVSDIKVKDLALIYFHGNGETIENTYNLLVWLSKNGYPAFSFDYRGYGKSTGWPSEKGLQVDSLSVWDYVKESTGLPAEKIILMAHSVGTGPAAFTAAEKEPGSLIVLSPFQSLTRAIKETPFFGVLYPFAWYRFPNQEYLEKLDLTCVFVLHGENDNIINVQHSRDMKRELGSRKNFEFIFLPDTGHNDIIARGREIILKRLTGLGNEPYRACGNMQLGK